MDPEVKRALEQNERVRVAEKAAERITSFVNPFGHDKESFVQAIVFKTHRTLQQSVAGLVFALIKAWAKQYHDGIYDGRNEQTCKTCAMIDQLMTENDEVMQERWDHLPCI